MYALRSFFIKTNSVWRGSLESKPLVDIVLYLSIFLRSAINYLNLSFNFKLEKLVSVYQQYHSTCGYVSCIFLKNIN